MSNILQKMIIFQYYCIHYSVWIETESAIFCSMEHNSFHSMPYITLLCPIFFRRAQYSNIAYIALYTDRNRKSNILFNWAQYSNNHGDPISKAFDDFRWMQNTEKCISIFAINCNIMSVSSSTSYQQLSQLKLNPACILGCTIGHVCDLHWRFYGGNLTKIQMNYISCKWNLKYQPSTNCAPPSIK